jgi:tripartite-type tricarboxylate transporter receptor subunit TctC
VRFKGTPENLTELLAGRLDFFCPADICLPLIQDGRLVALAMGSSKRSTVLSNLQTTVELAVPDPSYDFWVSMFMPTATPRDIVDNPDRETAKANPAVKESLGKPGAEQNLMDPRVFDSEIRKEIATNAALVKAAGVPIRSQ